MEKLYKCYTLHTGEKKPVAKSLEEAIRTTPLVTYPKEEKPLFGRLEEGIYFSEKNKNKIITTNGPGNLFSVVLDDTERPSKQHWIYDFNHERFITVTPKADTVIEPAEGFVVSFAHEYNDPFENDVIDLLIVNLFHYIDALESHIYNFPEFDIISFTAVTNCGTEKFLKHFNSVLKYSYSMRKLSLC